MRVTLTPGILAAPSPMLNIAFIILGRLKLLKVISVHVTFEVMVLCVLARFGDRGVLRPISLVGSATYSHVNFFYYSFLQILFSNHC